MARTKNKGTFIIDDSISQTDRETIDERVQKRIVALKDEIDERRPIIEKRQDFFEGRHARWTNVVGQTDKGAEGRIRLAINYVRRFVQKVHQALTNSPPRIKIKPLDETDEIETARAEAVENAVYKVLNDNFFFNVINKRTTNNQLRDGDYVVSCKVIEDDENGKQILIEHAEDLLKIAVGWDDMAGREFSFVAFQDKWSIDKIRREFNVEDVNEFKEDATRGNYDKGDHLRDQYGLFANDRNSQSAVPSGQDKRAKAEIIDYWGFEVLKKKSDSKAKLYVVNLIYLNRDLRQFVITDYQRIPKFIGHSFGSAGKPWSYSFIDDLVDPQVEINDRSAEEGDLVRIGSHIKFLAINMPDFDSKSVRPGKGQVIFVEGENVDFRPLNINQSNIPSEAYINRMLDHLFNLGIPKIALAAGTAPYTGRVAATQYQPFVDLVNDLRIQQEVVLTDLIKTIQQYFIDYFPEMHPILQARTENPETGEVEEGEPTIRDIEFDWDNVLPLSRSDKVVDAATLYDRGVLSIHTTLSEAGFRNPGEEIKKLKKERNDKDLMSIKEKYSDLSRGVVRAGLEARKQQMESEEENAAMVGQANEAAGGGTPAANKPILTPEQNDGRRGILTGTGTPTGQTATPRGAVAQTSQNINAQNGV